MALPLLTLGIKIGKIVAGTVKGLTVAGKATVKATAKGSKIVGKVASSTGRVIGKATQSTAKGLGKAVRATRKSMSNFSKRMSKRKTSGGIEKLKRNSEKIRNNLNRDIKKLKKQRLDRKRIQRNVLERSEVRKMEKNIESTKTPTGKKVNSILKSPMSIFDKIFGLGGILLAGIVVNAIDDIVKKWEEFNKNNKPMFDFIGNIIKGVGDFLGGIEISSMNKMDTDKGDYKKFAVFNKEGDLIGGKLVAVKETVETLGALAKKVIETIGKPRKKGVNAPTNTSFFLGGKPFQNRRAAGVADFLTFGYWDFDQRGNLGWFGGSTVHSKSGYGEEMEWKTFFNHEKQIKKNDNNIDLSFNTDENVNTTLMIAFQKEIEYVPFPIGNSGSSGGLSNYDAFTADLPAIWKES